jgi:hypothetical protein
MKKVFAGILFSVGFIFLAVTVSVILTKNPSEEDKSAALGGLIIGIPSTAGGAWIVWGLHKKKEESESDRQQQLETTFLSILDESHGRITTAKFAIATKLSLVESKLYLDKKAAALDANFNISEEGVVSYHFLI